MTERHGMSEQAIQDALELDPFYLALIEKAKSGAVDISDLQMKLKKIELKSGVSLSEEDKERLRELLEEWNRRRIPQSNCLTCAKILTTKDDQYIILKKIGIIHKLEPEGKYVEKRTKQMAKFCPNCINKLLKYIEKK